MIPPMEIEAIAVEMTTSGSVRALLHRLQNVVRKKRISIWPRLWSLKGRTLRYSNTNAVSILISLSVVCTQIIMINHNLTELQFGRLKLNSKSRRKNNSPENQRSKRDRNDWGVCNMTNGPNQVLPEVACRFSRFTLPPDRWAFAAS